MHRIHKLVYILLALIVAGCAASAQPAALTNIPSVTGTAATAVPTFRFMGDDCTQDRLRTYLQAFEVPMKQYEVSLADVYPLVTSPANPDQVTAAVNAETSARDGVVAMGAPSCAQKMQTALVSSMDHTIAGLQLAGGKDQARLRAEITQAGVDYTTAKNEFTLLSAQAGLDASPTP